MSNQEKDLTKDNNVDQANLFKRKPSVPVMGGDLSGGIAGAVERASELLASMTPDATPTVVALESASDRVNGLVAKYLFSGSSHGE